MGTTIQGHGLADALFSPVQQRVLGLLFGQPQRRFQSAELIRLAASGTGAVHRQLERLARAGLVVVECSGNHKYYQARPDAPVFEELCGLIRKTVGLAEPLRRALGPHRDQILAAFVYGSVARGDDRADSDIDLMVVSDTLGLAELFESLHELEGALGRAVNPMVVTVEEWRNKRRRRDSFAHRVAAGPRLFILGVDDDAAGAGQPGSHRPAQARATRKG